MVHHYLYLYASFYELSDENFWYKLYHIRGRHSDVSSSSVNFRYCPGSCGSQQLCSGCPFCGKPWKMKRDLQNWSPATSDKTEQIQITHMEASFILWSDSKVLVDLPLSTGSDVGDEEESENAFVSK